MTALRRLLAVCLLLCGCAAQAAGTVLWLTAEVTPPARTALVTRLAGAAGLAVAHLEFPLRGAATLDDSARQRLAAGLARADLVWVDAPHAAVQARLQALLGGTLAAYDARLPGRLVWVTAEAAARPSTTPSERMAAYLSAGGERNVRHAVSLGHALAARQTMPELPAPQPWPARGVYHPRAPELFADAAAFARWQQGEARLGALPPVAVLVHRHHFVNGSTAWLDAWLQMFEAQGLAAYAVFAQQADAAVLADLLEAPPPAGAVHPRVLVTHQLLSQPVALQALFLRWGVPVLATLPARHGDAAAWEQDAIGIPLGDVPVYLAQPEAAGAIDPVLVAAAGADGEQVLIPRQAEAVVARARRLVALQLRPAVRKQLVAMVYNYPAGGSNFGASFLNVPRSLEQVTRRLAQEGYDTREVPEAEWIGGLKPLLGAYYPGADLGALLATGQAAALPLAEYEAWWAGLPAAVRSRIEAHSGPPDRSRFVVPWRGEPVFVIPRLQVGALAVLPQPPREENWRRGQDAFAHRTQVPLSHHFLATYLWAGRADALLHFGTHGTQEWAAGKARGLDVHDDALLPLAGAAGHVPVIYPYIVDNLGEALTAKRRGRAVLVSHRTPVFSPAGFATRMAGMHELMHEWEIADAGPTRRALERRLVAQFVEHRLDRDLGWTAPRITADFPGFLEVLHPYLDQLAQSAQPRGLAVFGRVPDADLRRQTILLALRKPLIAALGEDIDEAFLIDHRAVAISRPARWLELALRDPAAASVLDLRPGESGTSVPNRAARQPIDSDALLRLAHRAQRLEALLATEGELPGLLAALEGRFVAAAYGGDPIRNPESLPTGRNLTGLDPSRLPTREAYAVAQDLFEQWLRSWRADHAGRFPARLALSLWAGETLRHQGVMESQALVALGVRPVWDDAGRPGGLEVVPAGELGRPRVDVLLSVTGSYRDQFPALMALIDRAVAAAAGAPDAGHVNAVARNTERIRMELRAAGMPAAQAEALSAARVFGNAPGDYGTGIAEAVQSGALARDGSGHDARLGELFLHRMNHPYVQGRAMADLAPAATVQAFAAHLRQTDAAVLSRSSHLFGVISSDDPFQYLGGLAAAARSAGRRGPLELFVQQLQDSEEPVTHTARRSVALEMQARYLHPGWLQAQREEGYAGTLQVLKAVQFAWGWQAVAPDTVRPDHWQSFFEVLVKDKHALGLPQWLRSHPEAYAQALERLVQAQRLGYWRADATTLRELARLYRELTRAAPLAAELAEVRQWAQQVERAATGPRAPRPDAQSSVRRSDDPAPPVLPAPVSPVERAPLVGVLLERQPAPGVGQLLPRLLVWLLLAVLVLGGVAWQARRRSIHSF